MAIFIWSQWIVYLNWWLPSKLLWALFSLALLPSAPPFAASPPISPLMLQPPQQPMDDAAVLSAVGDIANCDIDDAHHVETAALLNTLSGSVALLGDIAYPSGRASDFAGCYEPAWGQHNERVRPVPGNHEYRTGGAAGYFGYFGATASPLEPACVRDCKGYYSYELGEWHIVALNSEHSMRAGSEQEEWLRADLAAHPTQCALAYWHHPRFSSGHHGNDTHSADVWQALYEAGVDVVLNGHDHDYERFAPQNPDGELDKLRGIREFVVGTGGTGLREFDVIQENSEARNSTTWGVLQLMLYADRYEWEFVPVAGQEFTDSGSAPCTGGAINLPLRHYLPALYQ